MRYRLSSLIARVKHLSKRKRNRVLTLIIFINLILAFLIYSNLVTYPHTFLGSTNISGKTAAQITALLAEQEKIVPVVQVRDRTYHYGYDQMGIVIDSSVGVHDAFSPNRKVFPLNLLAFFESLTTKRVITVPLVFTQAFDEFLTENTFDFSSKPDVVTVDPETKAVIVEENSLTYRLNEPSFRSLLLSRFGSYTNPIYPQLDKVTNESIHQIADTNQRLNAIFADPIMLYLDLGGTVQSVELKGEDIRSATSVTLTPDNIHVSVAVNKEALNTVIIKRVHALGFPIRDNVVTDRVRDDFAKAVYLRFDGSPVTAVATTLEDGPTTNGSLAKKYIEIDIQQAKMYLFKDGEMLKSYKVSTGSDYPTPTGNFAIINKVGLGYSRIYHDWLPWWMGFAYSKELNAYFGIHEQPYILTSDGKQVSASPQAIGTPSTGGCVALAPGAAREVYAFAEVGTPVYIFN